MTVRLEEFSKDFTPEERAQVAARTAELVGVEQEIVSRLERRADLLLSTLGSYVAAMGGTLRLVAEFPNRHPVSIELADITGSAGSPVSRRRDRPMVRQGRGPVAAAAGRLPCPGHFQTARQPVPCSADMRNYQAYTGASLFTTPLHRVATIGQAVQTCRGPAGPARAHDL
jgi:hypothetical protein